MLSRTAIPWLATAALAAACGNETLDRTATATSGVGAMSSATSTGSSTQSGASGGMGAMPDGVACGQTTCAAGEYCCLPLIAMPVSCETDEQACDAGFSILVLCDGPEDCPSGWVCCYTMNGTGATPEAGRAECVDQACDGDGQQQVCDPENSAACTSGTCMTNGVLPVCA